MLVNYRAAWVPDDDPHRPWDAAAALAVVWIEAEAASQSRDAILLTNTLDGHGFGGPLSRYVRGRTHFSPRSRPTGRGAPVLAYVPTPDTLELAMSVARGSAICVVESVAHPVRGWAAVVGAVNLLTGQPTTVDARLAKPLQRLKFYGNNGYGPDFDRRSAQLILDDLRGEGLLDRDLIVGGLAALHISVRGQQRIRQMIDKMS